MKGRTEAANPPLQRLPGKGKEKKGEGGEKEVGVCCHSSGLCEGTGAGATRLEANTLRA